VGINAMPDPVLGEESIAAAFNVEYQKCFTWQLSGIATI
jgi:hypothetical protein